MSDMKMDAVRKVLSENPAVRKFMCAVPDEATIFHYTSQKGFLGIMQSKSLWLSGIQHLNDSPEFAYAVDLARDKLNRKLPTEAGPLKSYYEKVLECLDQTAGMAPFVVSFSENGDLLSQWRAYTPNGIGFSIGFEYEYLKDLAIKQGFRIAPCIYDQPEQDAILAEIINVGEAIIKDGLDGDPVMTFLVGFYTFAPALKHPSFREEREWRVVSEFTGPNDAETRHRPGKSMLIPYREFNLKKDNGKIYLSKLFVGPSPHMELSRSTLSNLFLASHEVEGCPISLSNVPYRSW